jgi:ribose transport system substrate-binding protein
LCYPAAFKYRFHAADNDSGTQAGYTVFVKNLLRTGIIIFGLLSLLTFIISFSMARLLYVRSSREPPLNFHFALYLPLTAAETAGRGTSAANSNSFFTDIIAGAEKAAAENGASISIHSIDPARNELEMAAYTGVDGVVVCPYLDDNLARRQLDKIGAAGIPTVIINHNIPNDQPWPFIGTNNFDVGRRIGLAAGTISSGPIRLAMVYSDKAPGIYGERELVEMGISAALESRLAAPIAGFRTNLNPLDAEAMLSQLFRTPQELNIIVFTDPNDTIAAAQTLIDMNLVGRVQLIGFGNDPGVVENIRKGIVACSVVINPDRIGYEAVRSLANLRRTGYTSTSIDTGLELIWGDAFK